MSSFDPSFEYFRVARRRQSKAIENCRYFNTFCNFARTGSSTCCDGLGDYVIQFVCYPNFEQDKKTILYYLFDSSRGAFQEFEELPDGYHRGNSYQNYITGRGEGHPKGLYFELNLYTLSGHSSHHTSRVKGSLYERDDSHDINHGLTKGRHWLE